MENDCKNQITFFDDNYSYFKKISNFNDETYKMLNKHFFKDNVLKSEKADREIKKIFFTRFLNREIGRQTFEIFLTELVHILYLYDDVLSFYYDNIELLHKKLQKIIIQMKTLSIIEAYLVLYLKKI